MIPKAELNQEEQRVYAAIARLAGNGMGVNPATIAYALPALDAYAVIHRLVCRGVLERVGAGGGGNQIIGKTQTDRNVRLN